MRSQIGGIVVANINNKKTQIMEVRFVCKDCRMAELKS
jgi:hypothetical protein